MMMEVCSFPVDDFMVTVSLWLMFGWAKHRCVFLWLTISMWMLGNVTSPSWL